MKRILVHLMILALVLAVAVPSCSVLPAGFVKPAPPKERVFENVNDTVFIFTDLRRGYVCYGSYYGGLACFEEEK